MGRPIMEREEWRVPDELASLSDKRTTTGTAPCVTKGQPDLVFQGTEDKDDAGNDRFTTELTDNVSVVSVQNPDGAIEHTVKNRDSILSSIVPSGASFSLREAHVMSVRNAARYVPGTVSHADSLKSTDDTASKETAPSHA